MNSPGLTLQQQIRHNTAVVVFNIQQHERKIFQQISEAASELGVPAYVVGGYVRDRLLGRASKDMDIVCVGSGIKLAQHVASYLRPIPRVTVYRRFGTAMLRHKDLEIEFVGARKESYRADSRKPSVEEGSLEDDQNRRDFTINALAVSLNERDFGRIEDPFNGLGDLENKIRQNSTGAWQNLFRRPPPNDAGHPVCKSVGFYTGTKHPPVNIKIPKPDRHCFSGKNYYRAQ